MKRSPIPRAIDRANWFAELSAAIDDGERVLAQLIAAKISPTDTERLRLRLIALRAELERLNRVRMIGDRVVGSSWPERADPKRRRSA